MQLAKFVTATSAALTLSVLAQSAWVQKVLAQAAQTQASADSSDPLISRGSNLAIYAGLVLLIIALGFAVKNLSYRLERVLVFAFALTVIFLAILWYL